MLVTVGAPGDGQARGLDADVVGSGNAPPNANAAMLFDPTVMRRARRDGVVKVADAGKRPRWIFRPRANHLELPAGGSARFPI